MIGVQRWKLWAVTGAVVFAMASAVVVRIVAAEPKPKQDAPGASVAKSQAEAAEAAEREAKLKAEAGGK